MSEPLAETQASRLTRREILQVLAGVGIVEGTFARALSAQVADTGAVTPEMIQQAEWIAGIPLSDEQRQGIAQGLQRSLTKFAALRNVAVGTDVLPALTFHPLAWQKPANEPVQRKVELTTPANIPKPGSDDDLAFLPVSRNARLLERREVSSVELTRLYLERLRRFNPMLLCVVSLLEETALRQAEVADQELARGHRRGPLHGIPWGAKDLIAVPGAATTWGAPQYRQQTLGTMATVARRLADAGTVLLAKLSLGALAWGDDWFGGVTRNPWNQKEGSSGSSAGSAAATAAGLVGFALGSETLGSIVSPCTRCGTTGLRPTYGRVSRHGCMSLAWSMDKLGPIARSVEDCALVFSAIHGPDGFDPVVVDRSFVWPSPRPLHELRVGYFPERAEEPGSVDLKALAGLGVQLVPLKFPDKLPVEPLTLILDVESATMFDELTRQGNLDGLNRWPPVFRQSEFIPAIEYLRANRVRTLWMRAMEELFREVDVYVGGDDLVVTNLTGHPTLVLPAELTDRNGCSTPTSITFTGRLCGEEALLAVGHAYQEATGHHLRRPPLHRWQPLEDGSIPE